MRDPATDFVAMMDIAAHGPDTFVGTGPRYPWGGLFGGQIVAQVLRAVQDGLVAGLRLTPDDVRPIAHLVALGERRRPGDFLRTCPPTALLSLAEAVIVAEAMFGRFGGYAAWDGVEPAPPEGGEWVDGGFGERWHDALVTNVLYRNFAGGPSSPDSAFGGH